MGRNTGRQRNNMEPVHSSIKYFLERESTASNKKGVGATEGTNTVSMSTTSGMVVSMKNRKKLTNAGCRNGWGRQEKRSEGGSGSAGDRRRWMEVPVRPAAKVHGRAGRKIVERGKEGRMGDGKTGQTEVHFGR